MKTYGKLIALALAAGLVAFAAPSAMAVPAGSTILDTENTCQFDMSAVIDNATCASEETINPAGVGSELIAMNDLGDDFDTLQIGEDAWTDGWIMAPTKKLLASPLKVAADMPAIQSCAAQATVDADTMALMSKLTDNVAAATDICLLDISGVGVGLSTT